MDSGRGSALELLQGLLTSREVLRASEPRLSLFCKEFTWEHYRKLNLTFFTLFAKGSTGVYIGGVGRCNLVGQPSLVAPPPFPHWILHLLTYLDTWQKCFLECARTCPAGPTLDRLGPSLVPHRLSMSYCL
jgi:hypothetical protein